MKLKALELGAREILSREQLKRVMGGGTCQGFTQNPNGSAGTGWVDTGLTLSGASGGASNGTYDRWCCDSCCEADWADHSNCGGSSGSSSGSTGSGNSNYMC